MAPELDFAGNLNFLNLGELMQLLGSSSATGTLRVRSPFRNEPGLIMFEKGNPINAKNGGKSGMEALFALFGWTEGRFEFTRENITCARAIQKGRMEIILDGLRLLDEGKVEKLGPSPALERSKTDASAAAVSSAELPPLIKGPLVDYAYVIDEEGFYDGEEIVHEGAHGNWIWVILEGAAEIIKQTPNGPLKLLRVGDGAFLGSVASLLIGDNVRSTTVVASGNVQLGMLDTHLLAAELANLSNDFKSLIKSLDNRLRCVTGIGADAHAPAIRLMDLIKGKQMAIREGQKEERLFRIRAGEVVIARRQGTSHVPLARLQKGDFFGHIPFLTIGHEPYAAAVFSTPDLKLAAVDAQMMEAEHRGLSTTLRNILEHLAACISATTLVTINRIRRSSLHSPAGSCTGVHPPDE
jgi:CRP-like cAMP-binding protein